MVDWPLCMTEAETLAKMNDGFSISRLGDGELGIILGGSTSTHKYSEALGEEMREILWTPSSACIPAIPTMDPKSPRYDNWSLSKKRYMTILDPNRTYGSAFVGQSVSSPWIQTDEHIDNFKKLWRGKRVVCISTGKPDATKMRVWQGTDLVMDYIGGDIGLEDVLRPDAAEVLPMVCLELEAYSKIDEYEARCHELKPDLVVMCAGPMATVLANRLAHQGIQGIDFGRGLGVVIRHVYHKSIKRDA